MKRLLFVCGVFYPEPVVSARLQTDLAIKLSENCQITVLRPHPDERQQEAGLSPAEILCRPARYQRVYAGAEADGRHPDYGGYALGGHLIRYRERRQGGRLRALAERRPPVILAGPPPVQCLPECQVAGPCLCGYAHGPRPRPQGHSGQSFPQRSRHDTLQGPPALGCSRADCRA